MDRRLPFPPLCDTSVPVLLFSLSLFFSTLLRFHWYCYGSDFPSPFAGGSGFFNNFLFYAVLAGVGFAFSNQEEFVFCAFPRF